MNFNGLKDTSLAGLTLDEFQDLLVIWTNHNFPEATEDQQVLGMMEELGEFAHAKLKDEQGIRGTKEKHVEAMKDALGDLLVFVSNFCNHRGWSLQQILIDTWDEIKTRDWQKDKLAGGQ